MAVAASALPRACGDGGGRLLRGDAAAFFFSSLDAGGGRLALGRLSWTRGVAGGRALGIGGLRSVAVQAVRG